MFFFRDIFGLEDGSQKVGKSRTPSAYLFPRSPREGGREVLTITRKREFQKMSLEGRRLFPIHLEEEV